MDTNLTLLIIAVILFIALLIFDFAFFRFRERKFEEGEPLSFIAQDTMRRLQAWTEAMRQPKSSEPSFGEVDENQVETDFAIPARAQQNVTSQSAPLNSELPLAERPPVHVKITADIPEGTIVHITMQVTDSNGRVSVQKNALVSKPSTEKRQLSLSPRGVNAIGPWISAQVNKIKSRTANIHTILFWGSIILYALIVSYAIDYWPIYFFTDEAIHMNMIADFLADGFKNYDGEFLPTFFIKEGWVNGTSVYLQLVPYLLFGKSMIVTRLVSAFITLAGAIAIGLLLKKILKVKYYWAGLFLLLTTPAWFLHARTAFEYAEVAAFYCMFIYFYGRYRKGDLRSLYFAIFTAALCFYTHGLGQILTGTTGLALLVIDFRYHIHRKRRATILIGLALGIILLLPFVRYYLAHPTEIAEQVKRRNSYWSNGDLTLQAKMLEFLGQYFYGINPLYWYGPNDVDFNRHIMKGFGNGLWITLPFMVIGFYQLFRTIRNRGYRVGIIALMTVCPIVLSTLIHMYTIDGQWKPDVVSPPMPAEVLINGLWVAFFFALIGLFLAFKNIRNPAHKLVLIVFLACPVPASVAAIGMPRTLFMSIPLAILATIGLSSVIRWTEDRLQFKPVWNAWRVFAALTILSVFVLRSALVDGPVWFDDYGLYGMQFGAKQVFQETVRPALEADPNVRFVISPSWANGTEQFVAFFIPEEMRDRVHLGQPIDHADNPAMFESTQFIATTAEFTALRQDPKFNRELNMIDTILYPNGRPGFYVLSLRPAANIAELMEAERAKNRTPIESTMVFKGEEIRVVHSPIGSGSMELIFDNDPDSVTRVEEANPFFIALYPKTPISTKSVLIKTGSMHNFTVTIRLYATDGSEPVEYVQTFKDEPDKSLPPDPEFEIILDRGPESSSRVEIEVKDNLSGESSSIHIRTVQFK